MGVFDTIKQALGMAAEADATRKADPEDLFGMSTAYVTMEADLDYHSAGEAALCFSGVDSTAFTRAKEEVEAILDAGGEETGTVADFRRDTHGYEWVVLADPDFEDLVTSIHFAADTLIESGFGSRLLAAVFAFERDGANAYWVYSFRRGAYYPFVPAGGHERDGMAEFKLESVLEGELGLEADKEYWYPLWPDGDTHPWGAALADDR
ncbi:PspA-associated protein PspAB [Natronomonas sp. EA1]|uniref:PspA-associated protein PspAB n=1 Tax=Natronomonas sp. EA1 TaxID=3421655 RepID=UPI003EBC289D